MWLLERTNVTACSRSYMSRWIQCIRAALSLFTSSPLPPPHMLNPTTFSVSA